MTVKRETPTLDKLLALLRQKTAEPGAQRALATAMDVTPQRLNDYLAGRYEPSGEVSLRLAEWAGVLEFPKPKSAGRGATRPTPKPKPGNHANENTSSGRRKK